VQIDQIEDSTQRVIDLEPKGKPQHSNPAEKSGLGPLEDDLTRAVVSESHLRRISSHSEVPSVVTDLGNGKPRTIHSRVQIRFALRAEGKGRAVFCHFDRGDASCRPFFIAANISASNIQSSLKRSDKKALQLLAVEGLAKCLLKRGDAMTEALLVQCKTLAGIAPYQDVGIREFSAALAESALLAGLPFLPIYGRAFGNTIGRSFALAEIDLRISRDALGTPWNRRRDPFF
jgi:hypothetical protein